MSCGQTVSCLHEGKRGKEIGTAGKVPNSAATRSWCFTQKQNFNQDSWVFLNSGRWASC